MQTLTFKKQERLCSKKSIDILFAKGMSFYINPLKVKWASEEYNTVSPAKLLVVVPKRYFKKAVVRNKLKRQIREAYRKNKNLLFETLLIQQKSISLAVIYNDKEISSYKTIENKIILILQRLKQLLEN
ncbi:MAG: ribonuclease P protein component [Bacteroidetes bacterium]|nr:ribonuclease P protein component [Bacteroidota bacterium]